MTSFEAEYRARRISLGLTQEAAARAAGISRRTLTAFEGGAGGLSLANLKRLMSAVGLVLAAREATSRPTLDELSSHYGGEEPKPLRKRARRKGRP
ncbi:MAG: helix-turn-helix domain-containing protein [Usitatibacter sp.]